MSKKIDSIKREVNFANENEMLFEKGNLQLFL
jgi:hypothetical protein